MVTGNAISYSHGQITTKLDNFKEFTQLSVGTKEFFQKALNINVFRRYSSAEEWLDALEVLNLKLGEESFRLELAGGKNSG